MKSRLHVMVPAVFVAASIVLLSACDDTGRLAGEKSGTASAEVAKAARNMVEGGLLGESPIGDGEVDCGPLDEDAGDYTRLIAVETPDGIVGCDEAFQVLSEYNESPFGQTDGDTTVVSGWTCVTTAHPNYPAELMVFCTDGTLFEEEGPADGRLFLTLPADAFAEEQAEEPLEPRGQQAGEGAGVELPVMEHLNNPGDVYCGTLPDDPEGTRVMAMRTPWGVASCDEAQQVVTEMQNAVNVGTDLGNDVWLLPSGWVCGGIVHPDYPDEQTLYCDSGYVDEVGEFVDGLVVYTQPDGR